MNRSNIVTSCGPPLSRFPQGDSLAHRIPGYTSLVLAHNGYILDGGLYRIYGVNAPGLVSRDLDDWSRAEWRDTYPVPSNLLFFAENIFGDQIGYDTRSQTFISFDCEGGKLTPLAFSSAGDWLESFRHGSPEDWIELDLVTAAAREGLIPTPTEHLSFELPLIAGGTPSAENLEVLDGAMHLSILGQITNQSRSVPAGTKIRSFRTVR